MIRWSILLSLVASPVLASQSKVHGSLAIVDSHHFQGMDQSQGRTSAMASVEYRPVDGIGVGVWVGEHRLPQGFGNSIEVDYFVRLSRQLSFNQRIDTSLWRYTFVESSFDDYEWTQWLLSYHRDERLSLTLGASDNLLRSNKLTTFVEGTIRQSYGRVIGSLSLGRNNLSGTNFESFEYAEFRIAVHWGDFHAFADYTATNGVDGRIERLAHEGPSLGISYAF